jgi:hypothetical protein
MRSRGAWRRRPLRIDADKTDKTQLHAAVSCAVWHIARQYTSYEDTNTISPCAGIGV